MTKLFRRKGNKIIMDRSDHTEAEFSGKCEFCGNVDELRPYGPNNESICFTCAMKDEATTARKFREMLGGAD